MKEGAPPRPRGPGDVPRPVPRPDPARDGRAPPLRGAGHADRRAGRPGCRPRRATSCGGASSAEGDSPLPVLRAQFFKEARDARLHGGRGREALADDGEVFLLRLQQGPQRLVRVHGLPGRLSQGPSPRARTWPPSSTPAAATTCWPSTSRRPSASASRILGPDVNRSGIGFEVEGAAIRVGFTSIKSLALRTAEKIVEERTAGGGVRSRSRISWPGSGAAESELFPLIKAGVFDSLEARRTRQVLRYVQGIEGVEVAGRHRAPGEGQDAPRVARLQPRTATRSPSTRASAPTSGSGPAEARPGRRSSSSSGSWTPGARSRAAGCKYFYLFEDETGILEGVGDRIVPDDRASRPSAACGARCRMDGTGLPKIFDCAFSRSF